MLLCAASRFSRIRVADSECRFQNSHLAVPITDNVHRTKGRTPLQIRAPLLCTSTVCNHLTLASGTTLCMMSMCLASIQLGYYDELSWHPTTREGEVVCTVDRANLQRLHEVAVLNYYCVRMLLYVSADEIGNSCVRIHWRGSHLGDLRHMLADPVSADLLHACIAKPDIPLTRVQNLREELRSCGLAATARTHYGRRLVCSKVQAYIPHYRPLPTRICECH